MDKVDYFVYAIFLSPRKPAYIGQSAEPKKRIWWHHRRLARGDHPNKVLQGLADKTTRPLPFRSKILQKCTRENIDETEIFFIKKFNCPSNRARGRQGHRISEEQAAANNKKYYEWMFLNDPYAVAEYEGDACDQFSRNPVSPFVLDRMQSRSISPVVDEIRDAMELLPDNQRRVISGLWGIGREQLKVKELAEELSITARKTYRWERYAIKRLTEIFISALNT
jgi:DNA-directed RNA polymerase specialized sigma24 family protein